ncbi:hypothetical protein OOU_Y34scaffold00666g87 [Pyricularia oryzae Y34]|uniref:Uncharacterized protein n=3 Tax=Pyricularia oryzae TaxID=318829 RepID=Q2KG90_PYRO7|nr:hypothetical protein MGCH7_ch7g445 [Pyricularia oryzae 70-15]ELQ36226.1 hypothetical protein OOU_Y34scaffold00666g87 [Pyricularia oryzae Y34]
MAIPPSFVTILSVRPFGQSTLAMAQSYLSIRPVQIRKTFRFDSQCDAHAHRSHPSLLLAVTLRRVPLANETGATSAVLVQLAGSPRDCSRYGSDARQFSPMDSQGTACNH